MKKVPVSKINPNAARIPADDYELKPHYDVDYGKTKPNPFAGRVHFSRGGVRPGAGRKRAPEPLERHTITFYKSHVAFLRRVDSNLSKAIRKVLAAKAR